MATVNLARGRMMASDYMECQAGDWRKSEAHLSFLFTYISLGQNYFLSIFGVAWGVIPEVLLLLPNL